jgi:hypothetical protein
VLGFGPSSSNGRVEVDDVVDLVGGELGCTWRTSFSESFRSLPGGAMIRVLIWRRGTAIIVG